VLNFIAIDFKMYKKFKIMRRLNFLVHIIQSQLRWLYVICRQ